MEWQLLPHQHIDNRFFFKLYFCFVDSLHIDIFKLCFSRVPHTPKPLLPTTNTSNSYFPRTHNPPFSRVRHFFVTSFVFNSFRRRSLLYDFLPSNLTHYPSSLNSCTVTKVTLSSGWAFTKSFQAHTHSILTRIHRLGVGSLLGSVHKYLPINCVSCATKKAPTQIVR